MNMGSKTVTGNLANDPLWRDTANGRLLALRLLETQRVFNRESRNWEDGETTRFDVAITDERMAKNVMASAGKGDRLTVTGSYDVQSYVGSEGEAGLNHRIFANDVAASMKFTEVQVPERQKSAAAPGVDPWGPQATQEQPQQAAQEQPQQVAQANGVQGAAESGHVSPARRSDEAKQFGSRMTERFSQQGPPPVHSPSAGGPSY
ncbi:single-stranded DNA-binding protein [Glutamicibacter sp. FBE19]|uniref:single-stranded DNA-binding protein n=1 Tax=Glutamicibacter sp. FBE19 TaxID=2761534 RepID=UPI0018968CF1|nr:single-stranded DNA-binding protein [Glutamicibacter sp. FBE19]MBF6671162.1 single-stranded DNA-binding protein [Glutamicibacter sp. FBE19]